MLSILRIFSNIYMLKKKKKKKKKKKEKKKTIVQPRKPSSDDSSCVMHDFGIRVIITNDTARLTDIVHQTFLFVSRIVEMSN